MNHRQGLYVSNCECDECEKYREAIALGRNQGNAIPPFLRQKAAELIGSTTEQTVFQDAYRMSQEHYTPGPWSGLAKGQYGDMWEIRSEADQHGDQLVALVPGDCTSAEANAALIAAAPELLEVLERLMAVCRPRANEVPTPDWKWRLDLAEAVILKTQVKPYSCSFCEDRFHLLKDLMAHNKTAHDGKRVE